MRPPRIARRLPRYVRRKWLAVGQWGYFFEIPSWAKGAGCTINSKALGLDLEAAEQEAEDVLLPQFDSWRTHGASDIIPERARVGSFDWLVKMFKQNHKYTEKDKATRRTYNQGLALAANFVMQSGRRFGEADLASIDTNAADKLYEKLKIVTTTNEEGNIVERKRLATANAAMRSCRRAWNVVQRSHPRRVSTVNPFAKMGLSSKVKETPAANFDQLLKFIATAEEMNRSSLGTAALLAWEWAQREEHIFGHFDASHYRPRGRPNAVRVVHPKTNEEAWVPLFDDEGEAIYPELVARLDDITRVRIGGLLIVRDWNDARAKKPLPWMTAKEDLTYMRQEVRRIMLAASLPDELSFRSFRHGGVTESSDSGASEEEIRSITRHKSAVVLPRYSKRTMRKVANQAKKRRATRTKRGHLSE